MASDRRPPRGLVTMFTIPFTSALEDRELAELARAVDLPARCGAEAGPRESRFGPARLDHDSGLFLSSDGAAGRWVLEGKTWGNPAAESVWTRTSHLRSDVRESPRESSIGPSATPPTRTARLDDVAGRRRSPSCSGTGAARCARFGHRSIGSATDTSRVSRATRTEGPTSTARGLRRGCGPGWREGRCRHG
jgi:hypothetical protein